MDNPGTVVEAVLLGLNRTKDGWAMSIRIHPNDVKPEILELAPGQRLGLALVKIDDDDGAYRNREEIARIAQEEKLEASAKRRYRMTVDSIITSPYAMMWAEDQQLDDPDDDLIRRYIDTQTQADKWVDRVSKVEAIVKEVRKYGTPGNRSD